MTEPTSGEPWHKFRMEEDLWDRFGEQVGERKRSAVIRSLIQWQLENPTADLSAVPTTRRHVILVVVDEGADASQATVSVAPGTEGPGSEKVRQDIAAALDAYRKANPKRTGKAAK